MSSTPENFSGWDSSPGGHEVVFHGLTPAEREVKLEQEARDKVAWAADEKRLHIWTDRDGMIRRTALYPTGEEVHPAEHTMLYSTLGILCYQGGLKLRQYLKLLRSLDT